VVSVLPVDKANAPTYRVKSQPEPFARAAKEKLSQSRLLP